MIHAIVCSGLALGLIFVPCFIGAFVRLAKPWTREVSVPYDRLGCHFRMTFRFYPARILELYVIVDMGFGLSPFWHSRYYFRLLTGMDLVPWRENCYWGLSSVLELGSVQTFELQSSVSHSLIGVID